MPKATKTNAETEETAVAVASDGTTDEKEKTARLVVDKYAKWSFGVGFIPVPALDLVGLTAVQIKMLSEIAKIYGQSIGDNKLRSIVSSVLSALLPHAFGRTAGVSLFKSIPVLGQVAAAVILPVTSAAATYAVGTIFIKHFASGGSFLTIDLSSMKSQMKEKMAEARKGKATEDQDGITSQTA